MTNEIEKQFFEKFNIPKKLYCKKCDIARFSLALCAELNCKPFYPPITDHVLLELICIAHTSPVITFTSIDIKNLKEEVLLVLCNCINHRDIKQQVQALFKENN